MKNSLVKIKKQGSVLVNTKMSYINARSLHMVAISIDMKTKNAEISGIMDGNYIVLDYRPISDPMHLHRTKTGETIISFPQYKNWFIFCCDLSRYTLRVCLMNKDFTNEK
jgi:hypothetical protein